MNSRPASEATIQDVERRLSAVAPELPSRTEMLYKRLGETIEEIHAIGRRMEKAFATLGDCQVELEHRGVRVEPEFPQFVLTALSVYRTEVQRQSAENERGGR